MHTLCINHVYTNFWTKACCLIRVFWLGIARQHTHYWCLVLSIYHFWPIFHHVLFSQKYSACLLPFAGSLYQCLFRHWMDLCWSFRAMVASSTHQNLSPLTLGWGRYVVAPIMIITIIICVNQPYATFYAIWDNTPLKLITIFSCLWHWIVWMCVHYAAKV